MTTTQVLNLVFSVLFIALMAAIVVLLFRAQVQGFQRREHYEKILSESATTSLEAVRTIAESNRRLAAALEAKGVPPPEVDKKGG